MRPPRGVSFFRDARQWFGTMQFDVIFDVGANVGQSAHIFSDECPRAAIYCFEPVQRAFAELQRNVSYLPNVRTFKLAMGAARGEADMHVDTETALSSMVVQMPGSVVERALVSTLDGFCDENRINQIDFLKIDAEGSDVDVLRGARAMLAGGRMRFIQVEASFYDNNPRFLRVDRFSEFLGDYGYEAFGIYDQMPHPTGRPTVAYMNAVFVHRALLKEPLWR